MIQSVSLQTYNPYAYNSIPEDFKSSRNRWNYLAQHIEVYGTREVELYPREGVNPELVWRKAAEVLVREDLKDYHKFALVGWILWTGFYEFKADFNK